MGRVLLILTAACLAATFMIINNSSFRTATSSSPKNEEVSKKEQKDRQANRERDSRAGAARKSAANKLHPSGLSAAPSDTGTSIEKSAVVEASPDTEASEDPTHAIISGDQTPVYSVNSRGSRVIKMLKKGDRVTTDLEVIDGEGRWRIVKKADLNKAGFVLDENLQQRKPAKKGEPKK